MAADGVRMPERLSRAGVTEREAEVLSAVAERLRNREIAERWHVSVRTVESHIASLLRKLAVRDRFVAQARTYFHFASGGRLIRMASTLPPVLSPNKVPRS